MALSLTDINVGTVAGDGTGDDARTAFQAVNSNNATIESSVLLTDGTNELTGDLILAEKADHSSTPAAGKGYLWCKNTAPSTLIFTDDSGADTTLGSGGGGGDFKADGTVDMTGEFRTDVGTMDSDVANGATANAWAFDCANSMTTSGAMLARWKNAGVNKVGFDKDGILHLPATSGQNGRDESAVRFRSGTAAPNAHDPGIGASSSGRVLYFWFGSNATAELRLQDTNTMEFDQSSTIQSSAGNTLTVDGKSGLTLQSTSGTVSVASIMRVSASFTVAGLPTPTVGMVARVTDANAPSIGATVSGGGSAAALVWYNGSNWTVIGV